MPQMVIWTYSNRVTLRAYTTYNNEFNTSFIQGSRNSYSYFQGYTIVSLSLHLHEDLYLFGLWNIISFWRVWPKGHSDRSPTVWPKGHRRRPRLLYTLTIYISPINYSIQYPNQHFFLIYLTHHHVINTFAIQSLLLSGTSHQNKNNSDSTFHKTHICIHVVVAF